MNEFKKIFYSTAINLDMLLRFIILAIEISLMIFIIYFYFQY